MFIVRVVNLIFSSLFLFALPSLLNEKEREIYTETEGKRERSREMQKDKQTDGYLERSTERLRER